MWEEKKADEGTVRRRSNYSFFQGFPVCTLTERSRCASQALNSNPTKAQAEGSQGSKRDHTFTELWSAAAGRLETFFVALVC